ncbi:hypothetical protein [Azoarcus sp. DD4]|uniref:hypothetical protein n=1 Tax=Azoarcus sp. DD4 TaxID=2027405 RepID=UPI001129F79A|nr:hypothetical protein [Azoarcus sp. DD4]
MNLIVAFLCIFALSYANGAWMLRHLKTVHPEIWSQLGRPSLTQSNLGTSRLSLMKFIWSLKFRSLNDTALSSSCSAAIAFECALAIIFVAFVVGAA